MYFLFIIIFFIIIILVYYYNASQYKKSTYYALKKQPYYKTRFDLGCYGEYLIYKNLKELESDNSKFLFNLYIPAQENKTSEIDVLLISQSGIFVFESKNYSGWIFGDESRAKWCQCLHSENGKTRKNYFYNPIMQNKSHIKHLKSLIGEQIQTHSVIVFSERCTLKNINIHSADITVIKRDDILFKVKEISRRTEKALSSAEILDIYNFLYPYTQVSEELKLQHIKDIKDNF